MGWLKARVSLVPNAPIADMVPTRMSTCVLVLMCLSVPACGSQYGDAVRLHGKEMPSSSGSDSGLGEYERKTQSPMIWMKLRKTQLKTESPTLLNVGYDEAAKQRLGKLEA